MRCSLWTHCVWLRGSLKKRKQSTPKNENRKRNDLMLTISIFSIFIMGFEGRENVENGLIRSPFYYFRLLPCARAQMCKKLNSERLMECGKSFHFPSSGNCMEFNGNFHQKSSAKCVRSTFRWCDNGKVNDYKWIRRLPSIIFKRLVSDLFPLRHDPSG